MSTTSPTPARHQLNPTENESPCQDLTKLSITLHQSQHMLAIQFDHLSWLSGTHAKKSPSARQRADLAGELTRAMNGNKGLNGARGAYNLKLAGYNYKEWRMRCLPAHRALRQAPSHACAHALQCDQSALALTLEISVQHELLLAEVLCVCRSYLLFPVQLLLINHRSNLSPFSDGLQLHFISYLLLFVPSILYTTASLFFRFITTMGPMI